MWNIGPEITLLRQTRRLTVDDVIKMSGISRGAYFDLINKKRGRPQNKTLEAVAKILGVEIGVDEEGYPYFYEDVTDVDTDDELGELDDDEKFILDSFRRKIC